MGMSIDKHIKILELYNNGFSGYVGCLQETIDAALDTMRKYQKIKRIIKAVDDRDIGYATMMDALHKVVEDGNDDNRIHEE